MPGVQEHPTRSDWDDESPKHKTLPDEPASKRLKTDAAHPPAATSRRLDATVAKDILAFLDVHKVSDAMTVGSLAIAFDETRQPLEVLQLQDKIRVGVLKVLLKVAAKDHPNAATMSNDASRQDTVTSQGLLAGAQSSKTDTEQPSLKRKREPASQAKNPKTQPVAAPSHAQEGMLNATRKDAAIQAINNGPVIPDASSPKKNAGNKEKPAVSITHDSGSRKRKCTEIDDEEPLAIDTVKRDIGKDRIAPISVKRDIGKDGIAPESSRNSKKVKLGHLGNVTSSRSNRLPRVVDEPKQPKAKEPPNRYQLTPKSKPKPEASAPVQKAVENVRPRRTQGHHGKPVLKSKPDHPSDVTVPRSDQTGTRVAAEPSKPKAKGPEIKTKPMTKSKPEANAKAQPVVAKTPSLRSQHVTDEARKPKRKATEDGHEPTKKPKLDVDGNFSTRSNPSAPRAFEKPVKPRAKEPENRFKLTRAAKPAAGLDVRPTKNIPPPRQNKRGVPEPIGTEAEESEERRKRQKTGAKSAIRPDILASTKERETPRPENKEEFDMKEFLRSNGVFRQYEVERRSLAEELAEQDRLTADRRKRERQERRKVCDLIQLLYYKH